MSRSSSWELRKTRTQARLGNYPISENNCRAWLASALPLLLISISSKLNDPIIHTAQWSRIPQNSNRPLFYNLFSMSNCDQHCKKCPRFYFLDTPGYVSKLILKKKILLKMEFFRFFWQIGSKNRLLKTKPTSIAFFEVFWITVYCYSLWLISS